MSLLDYFNITVFLGGVIGLLSGFFVYLNDRESLTNRVWLVLNICTAIWSLSYFSMINASQHSYGLYSNWVMHFAAIYIPAIYLLFILFLTNSYDRHKKVFSGIAIAVAIFLILNMSPLFVKDVIPKYIFHYATDAGPLYIYFTAYFFITILYALGVLVYSILSIRNNDEEKNKLKLVLYSSIVGFSGGGSVFFMTFNIDLPPYPLILFALYPIIISYAIIRHHLFSIKIFAAQVLTFTLLVFIAVRASLTNTSSSYLVNAIFFVVTAMFGIFLIRSIQKDFQRKEELQLMANQLSRANQRLKKLDRAKSEFISIASHQLRTPLTAVKGFISLILEGSYGKVTPAINNALTKVYLSNERLIRLVEDLLSISRIESGRMEYRLKKWDMEEIVQEVYELFAIRARDKGVEFVFEKPKKKLPKITLDGDKMREVISNIVDNSIKYTNKGSITISLEQRDSLIRVTIEDTGIGILAEDIDNLFGKFERGKDTERLHANGTGLGLYVAKNIIEAHKGHVWAESQGRGQGSQFYIELPIEYVQKDDVDML